MGRQRFIHLYFVRLPLIVLILLLVGMGIFAKRGWLDWQRVVTQTRETEMKLSRMQGEKVSLERQIHSFRSDREIQERVLRQILGYVRANETVIEFD